MAKQKLSPQARIAKRIRDKKFAMTPERREKKAENQKKRREAERNGRDLTGLDYDHKDGRFETIKRNRGNDGNGTKKEA